MGKGGKVKRIQVPGLRAGKRRPKPVHLVEHSRYPQPVFEVGDKQYAFIHNTTMSTLNLHEARGGRVLAGRWVEATPMVVEEGGGERHMRENENLSGKEVNIVNLGMGTEGKPWRLETAPRTVLPLFAAELARRGAERVIARDVFLSPESLEAAGFRFDGRRKAWVRDLPRLE